MTPTETFSPAQIMDNRRKLSAALRSDRYKQAVNAMHRPGPAYCCLGVCVVELTGAEPVFTPAGEYEDDAAQQPFYKQADRLLGISVCQRHELASANDRGMSFRHIADMIDALPAPEVKP